MSFRYAICNEMFGDWPHARVCEFVARTGYTGLEIAPYTLAPRITDVTGKQRRETRRVAEAAGLEIVGLHWLLAKTEGLHLTSPDAAVRKATSDYFVDLAYATADLDAEVMVLGSPAQRNLADGMTPQQAADFAVEVLTPLLPVLDDVGVTLCLEPLGPNETNFLNSCAEAIALADRLGSQRVKLQLDVKGLCSEGTPVPDLIRQFAARAGHFHANDSNRQAPGFGETEFAPIFAALAEANYGGWISVEAFEVNPDPETIARDSLEYMQAMAG
ncbi:MAG: sugar phosphate isomerase/epimerase [Gemmataceae bacterium]|nr:sugar phosphate isomerase/epimerase [Gemmataceae bacterium]